MKNLNKKIEESINNSNYINEGFIDAMKSILNKSNKKSDPKQYVNDVKDRTNEITDSIKEFDKVNGDNAKKFLNSFQETVNKISDILWKSDNESDKQLILDLWANVDKLYDIFNLYSKKINEISVK